MASYTPAAERLKDGYPACKYTPDSRSRLPVIPDLRFEYGYLRSVLPYIQIERSTSASVLTDVHSVDPAHEYERINMPGDQETEGNDKTLFPTPILPSEIIHVQWGRVIWITVRDQVVSPLLQGALWLVFFFETLPLCSILDDAFDRALASYYITPFSAQLGSKVGTFVHERIPTKEGSAVGWLRSWAKSLGLSRSNSNDNRL